MEEIWKDVVGYEGRYKVSNLGNFKYKRGQDFKISKSKANVHGYMSTVITGSTAKRMTCQIHRLVAEAFIPNPENKPQVNHKNGIKTDNRVENLEWCTQQENSVHAVVNKLYTPSHGDNHPNSKIKDSQVAEIFKLNSEGLSAFAISRLYNVSKYTILRILNKELKKHLSLGEEFSFKKRYAKIRKVTDDIVRSIRKDNAKGLSGKSISNKYGIAEATTSAIINNKRYADI